MPIGPINLSIIERCLHRKLSGGMLVALGATAIDAIYISLALFGLYAYFEAMLQYPVVIRGLQLTGVIILGWLGIKSIREWYSQKDILEKAKEDEKEEKKTESSPSGLRDFLLGVLLCGSNPFFVLFWIVVAGYFFNTFQSWNITPGASSYVAFLLMAIFGDLAWFGTVIALTLWTSKKMGKMLHWVHLVLGVLFLGFSLYGVFQMTREIPQIPQKSEKSLPSQEDK